MKHPPKHAHREREKMPKVHAEIKMMLFKTNYLNVVLMAYSQPDLRFQNEFKHSLHFFLARSMKHNSLVYYHPGRWPE